MNRPNKLEVRRMDESLGIVLPADLVDRMRIAEGDALYAVDVEGGVLLTTRDPALDRAMALYRRGAQRYGGALRQLGS